MRTATVILGFAALAGCAPAGRLTVERACNWERIDLTPVTAAGEPNRRYVTEGRPRVEVTIPLPGARFRRPVRAVSTAGGLAAEVVADEGDATLRLELPWDYPVEVRVADGTLHAEVEVHGSQWRVEKVFGKLPYQVLARRLRPDKVLRVHALVLPAPACQRLRVVTAGPTLLERKTVAELAAGKLAGINGGYFDVGGGAPLGAVKIAGEWIAMPLMDRTALLLPRDGPPRIAAVSWRGAVVIGGRRLPVTSFNRTPGPDEACAVTSRRWTGAASFPGFTAVPATGGLTVHLKPPVDGLPRVVLRSEPEVNGSILGAGPRLLRAGRLEVTKVAERFRPDVAESVTARSAVALDSRHGVILAMVEDFPPYGDGCSLEELAEVLRDEFQAIEAIALDSHTMSLLVVDGRPVGRPLLGRAQAVPDALVVDSP